MGNGATPVTLDGANGHLDGLTNTTWVPGVTKATTGRATTEDQLQQVSDAVGAGWKVNTGTVALVLAVYLMVLLLQRYLVAKK